MENRKKNSIIFICIALVITAVYVWFKSPYEAAKDGSLFIVKQNLWRYGDINSSQIYGGLGGTTKTGITMLHYAAMGGQVDVIEYLLDHGANIESETHLKLMTPLHYAANEHKHKAVKLLIERGANINARNQYDLTPLLVAIDPGWRLWGFSSRYRYELPGARGRTITYLLENGADPLMTDKWGMTSIMAAANRRDLVLMKKLLSLGVDVNARKTGLHPKRTAMDYLLGSNTSDDQKETMEPIVKEWLESVMSDKGA